MTYSTTCASFLATRYLNSCPYKVLTKTEKSLAVNCRNYYESGHRTPQLFSRKCRPKVLTNDKLAYSLDCFPSLIKTLDIQWKPSIDTYNYVVPRKLHRCVIAPDTAGWIIPSFGLLDPVVGQNIHSIFVADTVSWDEPLTQKSVRTVSSEGTIIARLMAAKSKLAPSLELSTALILADLYHKVTESDEM